MLAAWLPFFVISPLLIAVFLYIFFTLRIARWIAATAQAAFSAFAVFLLLSSRTGEIYARVGNYEGYLGIILRADVLASVFVLLTAVIFLAVTLHNLRSPSDHTGRLYWFLLFLLESVLIGLFLTRDLFNIFVLVEVGTVVVTILLMYDRKRRNMYAGMTFIMVNIVVVQFYLFGLGYLYFLTGVLDMEAVGTALATMERSELALPYALIMTAVAAKCSLLPMLTFLPKVNALMGSRFTVAALLSGLYIKTGIYIFIRLQPLFGGMGAGFFLVAGLLTAFAGVVLALAQKDIRLMLAYSTVAQAGMIVAGLSIADEHAHIGSIFHAVNHALLKTALFIGAGMLSYLYRTYDITKMRGLFRVDKWLGVAHALAVLGIVGAPMFNGFASKYYIAAGAVGVWEWLFTAVNLGTALVFVRYSALFFGKPQAETQKPDKDGFRHGVLLGMGVVFLSIGIFSAPLISHLSYHTMEMGWRSYAEKTAVFIISLAIAVFTYRKGLANRQFAQKLCGLQLSFKPMCVSIGIFFAILMVYVGLGY